MADTTEITVYSKNNCQQCRATKNWLIREGISFKELNVEDQPEYIDSLRLYGYMSLPVVAVGNLDNSWAGFRPNRLKELL